VSAGVDAVEPLLGASDVGGVDVGGVEVGGVEVGGVEVGGVEVGGVEVGGVVGVDDPLGAQFGCPPAYPPICCPAGSLGAPAFAPPPGTVPGLPVGDVPPVGAMVPDGDVAGVPVVQGVGEVLVVVPGGSSMYRPVPLGPRPEIPAGSTPRPPEPEPKPGMDALGCPDRYPLPSAWPLCPAAPPGPLGPLLAWFVIVARSLGTAKVTETTSSSAPAAASAGRSHACAERAWPAFGRSRARSRDSSSDSPLAMTASSLAITLTRVVICRGT
jgi:hypothetical protein